MKREPLVTAGSVSAVVSAIFVVIVAFGLPIDDDKQAAIIGAIAVIFPFVAPLFARSSVTPTSDPRNDAGVPLVPSPDA